MYSVHIFTIVKTISPKTHAVDAKRITLHNGVVGSFADALHLYRKVVKINPDLRFIRLETSATK